MMNIFASIIRMRTATDHRHPIDLNLFLSLVYKIGIALLFLVDLLLITDFDKN